MDDCLIIGAGVVGLSLAYELAGEGLSVRILEAGTPGQEASWAGAGILPPALVCSPASIDQLTALSNQLHQQWAEQLRTETGVDNGYRACGGICVALNDAAEAQALHRSAELWRAAGVKVESLPPEAFADCEPGLRPKIPVQAAYFLPGERQLRNPRHLKALLAGCALRGVRIEHGAPAETFETAGKRLIGVRTPGGMYQAERFCFTAGAWTRALVERLGSPIAVKPVRGQIVLLAANPRTLRRIINLGKRYIVPRADGRVLIGSTEEDAGFDRCTTAAAVQQLLEMALTLVPGLADARLERCWAGLRPGTNDGLPYLGGLPAFENAFVAAGHFRSGLQLSTGTAVAMSRMIRGIDPQINMHPFRLDR